MLSAYVKFADMFLTSSPISSFLHHTIPICSCVSIYATVSKPPAGSLPGLEGLATNGKVALERASRGSHHLLEEKPLQLSAVHDIRLGDGVAVVPLLVTGPERKNDASERPVEGSSDKLGTTNRAAATTFVGRSLGHRELFSQESEKVDSGGIKRDA
ncbi:hypothetical protein HG530_000948 [Fusarium avenaceum]|nr:hypothetical protein HG530_000948 [Fusarium avenaceum]